MKVPHTASLALLALSIAALAQQKDQPQNVAPRPGEIVIQAYVDGITELHVSREGLRWVNGAFAKPGLHDGNWPTFVNGQQWYPEWQKPNQARGVDRSKLFPLAVPSLNLELELIAVGKERDARGIEPRSPMTVNYGDDELVVIIPDPEFGPRWYTFALVPAKK